MPGLVGFTDKRHEHDTNMLLNMRRLLKHFDWYVDEELYFDEDIYASRTHIGVLNQGKQPYVYKSRFFSWLEGEFYNQSELNSIYNVVSLTDNELLVSIYHSTRSFDFLRDIDGYYASVLYDKEKGKLHLITDRYGFKPLYWGLVGDGLVWSSEVKGFLGHDGFRPAIDRQAVKEFFLVGYLLENRSWFEGVELVPPASVLTFDVRTSQVGIMHYWSWHAIKPRKEPIDEGEVIWELARLFKKSVRQRVNKSERIGMNLSGGLDSRAILAAVPEDYKPFHTFTFGQEGCQDIRIAAKVSRMKGARHHVLPLDSSNWLSPRISGVWKSDGLFNLLHMHPVGFYDVYKSYMDFNLNGFLGDAILGGSYIADDESMEYKVRNRGRRFINQALVMGESWLIHRRPFLDKDFAALIFAIPETLRANSYIYNKMLLTTFPEYYNDIPWQETGCLTSCSRWYVELIKLKNRVMSKLKRECQRFGFNLKDLRNYADYPIWIRQAPAKGIFEELLLRKTALYSDFLDRKEIYGWLRDHMEGKANYDNRLCLALTFELWLQQVFEGRYRS